MSQKLFPLCSTCANGGNGRLTFIQEQDSIVGVLLDGKPVIQHISRLPKKCMECNKPTRLFYQFVGQQFVAK